MTDKQIIIDGIDVAGCVYYKQECIANCGMFALGDFKCEGQICLYKQLKRKEQECEELREYHNKCCEEFENEKKELLEKYNQLSRDFYSGKYCNVEKCKQLDQLKAEIDKKELIFAGIETNNRLLIEKNNKLKQTLAEIKEIVEIEIECKTYEIENDCFNETRCKALNEHIDFIKQILQKISEVEDE